jgi:helicase MOV-10
LLERLCQHTVYTRGEDSGEFDVRVLTKLVENYRSHPAILELPNAMFYDGELRVAADPITTHSHVAWEHLPAAGVPLIFVGVQGKDMREESSPSWFNIAEVEQVLKYAKWLLENQTGTERVKPEHIGIIAPYAKQVQKIKKGLRLLQDHHPITCKDATQIMVGSTEQFQGQEKRVIIMSTVRASKEFVKSDTKHQLGFLTNPKRFNVAITRAKALLIVVGQPEVLAVDRHWRALIASCVTKGAYCGHPLPPPGVFGESGEGQATDTDRITRSFDRATLASAEVLHPSALVQQGFDRED